MKNMKTAITTLVMMLFAVTAIAGNVPDPLEGHSIPPVPLETHSITGGVFLNSTSADASMPELEAEEVETLETAEEIEAGFPDGYFTRNMKTLQGTLVEIDTEAMTARVRDGDAEIVFAYDRYTVFMKDFRPVDPVSFKGGARIVGLFDDSGGELYLGRLVEISKYRSRRRRRR